MNELWKRFFAADDADACGCGHHNHDHEADDELDDDFDEDITVEIEDPDTGETFEFYMADQFEFEGQTYAVLVNEGKDEDEYVIGRMVDGDDGDAYIETLGEDEEDAIYDAYEEILEEYFNEEDGDDAEPLDEDQD